MKKIFKSLGVLVGYLMYAPVVIAADIDVTQPTAGVPEGSIGALISNTITVVIAIAALATFAYLIWGGIQWITSGGDKTQYEAARSKITAALIGLAIVAAAWAVMQLVAKFFGVDVKNITIPGINPNVP